jgi:hypothetical protein
LTAPARSPSRPRHPRSPARPALGKGNFDVVKFGNSKHKTIVFDSNADTDNPRAYRMKLQGTGAGAPKKMVIFLAYSTPSGKDVRISMILRRDAD